MSRLAVAAWVGALCAAALPTGVLWWSTVFEVEESGFCHGSLLTPRSVWEWWFGPLILTLRADLHALLTLVMTLGVPVIVVLVGVVRWRSARVGGVLALFGVVQPLVRPYFDPVVCADVRLFSGQWFGRVGEALRESTSVSLLVAAVLVLVATQVLGPANDPAAAVAWRPVVRRVVGFLFCYWTLGLLVVVMDEMAVGYLNAGLLYWLSTASVLDNPWPLLVALVMIAYVPVRRAIAERRRG